MSEPFDFAPRTAAWLWWSLRPLQVAALVVAAALLALGLARWSALEQRRAGDESEVHRLQERAQRAGRQAQEAVAQPVVLAPAQVAQANAAIRQLNVPWGDVLEALQAAKGPRVALLDLAPDTASRRMRGTAEVAQPGDMFRFIERLKRQDALGGAELLDHQRNEQDPRKPLRFGFQVRWRE